MPMGDCLLQHVIPEPDLASLRRCAEQAQPFGVRSSRWMHRTVFGPGDNHVMTGIVNRKDRE